jgi:V/A-type H+/Na+-transporting ATPase subunit E
VLIMALEHVKEEIIDHAQSEGKKMVAEAKAEAKKSLDEAHGVIDTFEEETHVALEKELETLEKKYYAGMKMQAKKVTFQARKEVLTQLFADVRGKLEKSPKLERAKMLATLFQRAKKQCSVGKVYCAKQDIALVKKHCKNAVAADMFGGLILESKDGTIRIDYSFDSILAQVEEEKLQDVATLLF